MWEMWGTWLLCPPRITAFHGLQRAGSPRHPVSAAQEDSAECGLGCGAGICCFSPLRQPCRHIQGELLCLPRWGAGHAPPLCLCPPVCDVTELGVEVRCSEVTLGKPITCGPAHQGEGMQGRGLLSRMHCPVSVDSTWQAHLPAGNQEEGLRSSGGTRTPAGLGVRGRGG